MMTYGVVFEKIEGVDTLDGHYYAHVPALGLTTHGLGIDGARAAVLDLAKLWLAEKLAAGEKIPGASDFLFSTVEVSEDALQGA
jgi:predicted RNase H-like HicB family nuclease